MLVHPVGTYSASCKDSQCILWGLMLVHPVGTQRLLQLVKSSRMGALLLLTTDIPICPAQGHENVHESEGA